MNERIKSILYADSIKNMAAIGFFNNYPLEDFLIENNSAILFGKSDNLWMHISSSSAKDLPILLRQKQTVTNYFYSVEDWMIPHILEYGELDWMMTTIRFILNQNIKTDLSKSAYIKLDTSYAPYIFENSDYKEYLSIEYIEDRLKRDISAGIIKNNKLIAWGFTHDDGALGFLHVIEEERNRGYASDVLHALIEMRKTNHIPIFGNIITDNKASIKLVSKIGFIRDRNVSWIKLKSVRL